MMQTRVAHMRAALSELQALLDVVSGNGAGQRYLRQRREIGIACRALRESVGEIDATIDNIDAECEHARDWFY